MIRNFKHRGLRRLHERDDKGQVRPEFLDRIENILFLLENADTTADMDAPGLGLHALRGELKGFWAVRVSRNWRIIFRFEGGDAFDVDLIDYH